MCEEHDNHQEMNDVELLKLLTKKGNESNFNKVYWMLLIFIGYLFVFSIVGMEQEILFNIPIGEQEIALFDVLGLLLTFGFIILEGRYSYNYLMPKLRFHKRTTYIVILVVLLVLVSLSLLNVYILKLSITTFIYLFYIVALLSLRIIFRIEFNFETIKQKIKENKLEEGKHAS